MKLEDRNWKIARRGHSLVGGRWSASFNSRSLPARRRRSQDSELRFDKGEVVLLNREAAQALSLQGPVVRFSGLVQQDGEDGVLAMRVTR